jgi:hypothetical protein
MRPRAARDCPVSAAIAESKLQVSILAQGVDSSEGLAARIVDDFFKWALAERAAATRDRI